MGNSKSHEFSSLLTPHHPQDWQVIEQFDTHQLWQRRTDGKRFMAYPLNETLIDSEEKLQLYNFRKLNHGSLVSVESILSREQEHLCSSPKNSHILVENIPFTLAAFRRTLSLHEALTVLTAAFAGYNTLNYVYGPLFTDEQMVGFTEQGVPKVWVNSDFSSNEPSINASTGGEQLVESMEQRVYCCVQRVFDIVQVALAGGYPVGFRQEAEQVASFAEGQELVESYCRRTGIPLDDRIILRSNNKVEPLVFRTQTQLQSQRPSLNTFHTRAPCQDPSTLPTLNSQHLTAFPYISPLPTPTTITHSVVHRPLLRSSVNGNAKINFVFSTAANSVRINQPRANAAVQPPPLPPREQPLYDNKEEQQQVKYESEPAKIDMEPQRCHIEKVQKQDQSIIASECQHEEIHHHHILPPVRPHIHTVESREEIQLHFPGTHPEQPQTHIHPMLAVAQREEPQDIQELGVVNRSLPPLPPAPTGIDRVPTSQSAQEPAIVMRSLESDYNSAQPFDELKKWEESLLKLSAKQKQGPKQSHRVREESSGEQYLSEQRDKVHVDDQAQVRLFTNQTELQSYIRNKYRDFFAAEQAERQQQQKYQQQQEPFEDLGEGIRDPAIQQSSYFNQNYDVYQAQPVNDLPSLKTTKGISSSRHIIDQRKYTFGKIQLDPVSARQQYTSALEKEKSKGKAKHRASIQLTSLEDRYSKYVKNRQTRSRFYSKDISAILPPDSSATTKREYLHREYLPDSIKESQILIDRKPIQSASNLTYDKLRELLWA